MNKCIICGSESIPILQEQQLILLENWNSSCADSLSKTFGIHINNLIENHNYCFDCFQITREIDLLVRSINSLEIKLYVAEDEIKRRIQMDSTSPIAIAISTNSTTPIDLHRKRQMLRELRRKQKNELTTEEKSFVPLDTDRQNENECHQQKKEESKDFDLEENENAWNDDFIAQSLVETELGKSDGGQESFKTETPDQKPVLPNKTKSNSFKKKRKQKKIPKVFQCKETDCTFECSKRSLYKAHKDSVHKKPKTIRKRCQFCSISFDIKDKELLQDHEDKHRTSELPRCVINDCGMEFISSGSLKIHVRKSHQQQHESSVKCDICNQLFPRKELLGSHRFTMHPGNHRKELKCPDCNYTTFVLSRLASHQLIHNNERPYLCNQCGASYKRSTELNRHEHLHKNVKIFECKICGKTFLYPLGLKKHEETHATAKRYLCRGCGKAFRSKNNLQQHETHHCSNLPKKLTSLTRKKLKKQGIEVPTSTTVEEIKSILNN